MILKTANFINDGVVYSRGEEVSRFLSGDKVTLYENISEVLVKVMILDGESKGTLLTIDKVLLDYRER